MKTFDMQNGELSLIIGSTWLSRFELARLVPGSAVLTDRIAGTGFELRLNGERIAEADTALVELPSGEARLTARIVSLGRTGTPDPEPLRGTELTALLPVTVTLGRTSVNTESLAGLGLMSMIELGIPATREGDSWRAEASLAIAGFEAARGIVSVSGECMALNITSLAPGFPPAAFATAPFASTGRLLNPSEAAQRTKPYDFSKPDCFTRRQLEALTLLHEDALRAFALIRGSEAPALRVALTDQLNFTEYLETLPPGAPVYAAPATAAPRPFIHEEARPSRLFLAANTSGTASSGTPSPSPGYPEASVTDWVRASLSRPAGGSILLSGPLAETDREGFLEALRAAWSRTGSVSPRTPSVIETPQALPDKVRAFAPFAGEWEMIALIEIVSSRGYAITIAYPLRVLESVLPALEA